MQYLALLISKERELTPDERADRYGRLPKLPRQGRAGDPRRRRAVASATGARITRRPRRTDVTDGPFAEAAEIAGGYYVFEAENLDDALALARDIPAAQTRRDRSSADLPHLRRRVVGRSDAQWLALLLEPPAAVNTPGTPEWEAEAARHGEFAAAAGDHIVGGAALHEPATATTVRVRDGQVLLTDGPFAESAEIATGVYLLSAADRDEAVKLASMIPASAVEVRQLAGVSGL